MPQYCFKCPKCGYRDLFVLPINGRHVCPDCPVCKKVEIFSSMDRDITGEGCASLNQEYAKPILSESMGVTPEQVAERRARFPHIPHTDDGRVVISSLAEQNRFSKDLGFSDRN